MGPPKHQKGDKSVVKKAKSYYKKHSDNKKRKNRRRKVNEEEAAQLLDGNNFERLLRGKNAPSNKYSKKVSKDNSDSLKKPKDKKDKKDKKGKKDKKDKKETKKKPNVTEKIVEKEEEITETKPNESLEEQNEDDHSQEMGMEDEDPTIDFSKERRREGFLLDRILKKQTKTKKDESMWFLEGDEDHAIEDALPLAKKKAKMPKTIINSSSSSVININNETTLDENGDVIVEATEGVAITKQLAIDCEMVGVGPKGSKSVLARCSIVNKHGQVVLDTYCQCEERVTDFRTFVSGIKPHHLRNAPKFHSVKKAVTRIIRNKILVGHSIHHDLQSLNMKHPRHLVRDTATYHRFKRANGQKTSLKELAMSRLGVEMQTGSHSSVEDAQATMNLYLLVRKEWEKEVHVNRQEKRERNDKLKSKKYELQQYGNR